MVEIIALVLAGMTMALLVYVAKQDATSWK